MQVANKRKKSLPITHISTRAIRDIVMKISVCLFVALFGALLFGTTKPANALDFARDFVPRCVAAGGLSVSSGGYWRCLFNGGSRVIQHQDPHLALAAVEQYIQSQQDADSADIDRNTFFDWGNCGDQNRGAATIMCVLVTIFNWMAIGVAIAVVGGIIYGAILYTSSGAKSEQAKKGMGVIRNAIIALLLYFIMFAFLNFLMPGGLFTR